MCMWTPADGRQQQVVVVVAAAETDRGANHLGFYGLTSIRPVGVACNTYLISYHLIFNVIIIILAEFCQPIACVSIVSGPPQSRSHSLETDTDASKASFAVRCPSSVVPHPSVVGRVVVIRPSSVV